jgi:hypothetical protein
MPYDSISLHLAGKDASEKKAEIFLAAKERGMSVSQFLLSCYELVVASRKKREAAGASK